MDEQKPSATLDSTPRVLADGVVPKQQQESHKDGAGLPLAVQACICDRPPYTNTQPFAYLINKRFLYFILTPYFTFTQTCLTLMTAFAVILSWNFVSIPWIAVACKFTNTVLVQPYAAVILKWISLFPARPPPLFSQPVYSHISTAISNIVYADTITPGSMLDADANLLISSLVSATLIVLVLSRSHPSPLPTRWSVYPFVIAAQYAVYTAIVQELHDMMHMIPLPSGITLTSMHIDALSLAVLFLFSLAMFRWRPLQGSYASSWRDVFAFHLLALLEAARLGMLWRYSGWMTWQLPCWMMCLTIQHTIFRRTKGESKIVSNPQTHKRDATTLQNEFVQPPLGWTYLFRATVLLVQLSTATFQRSAVFVVAWLVVYIWWAFAQQWIATYVWRPFITHANYDPLNTTMVSKKRWQGWLATRSMKTLVFTTIGFLFVAARTVAYVPQWAIRIARFLFVSEHARWQHSVAIVMILYFAINVIQLKGYMHQIKRAQLEQAPVLPIVIEFHQTWTVCPILSLRLFSIELCLSIYSFATVPVWAVIGIVLIAIFNPSWFHSGTFGCIAQSDKLTTLLEFLRDGRALYAQTKIITVAPTGKFVLFVWLSRIRAWLGMSSDIIKWCQEADPLVYDSQRKQQDSLKRQSVAAIVCPTFTHAVFKGPTAAECATFAQELAGSINRIKKQSDEVPKGKNLFQSGACLLPACKPHTIDSITDLSRKAPAAIIRYGTTRDKWYYAILHGDLSTNLTPFLNRDDAKLPSDETNVHEPHFASVQVQWSDNQLVEWSNEARNMVVDVLTRSAGPFHAVPLDLSDEKSAASDWSFTAEAPDAMITDRTDCPFLPGIHQWTIEELEHFIVFELAIEKRSDRALRASSVVHEQMTEEEHAMTAKMIERLCREPISVVYTLTHSEPDQPTTVTMTLFETPYKFTEQRFQWWLVA